MYLTASVVKRMLGLQPILRGVPEIKQAVDALPEVKAIRRKGCGKCGKRGDTMPVSVAKNLSVVVLGLSEPKKQIILDTLGALQLRGFIGRDTKAVILASK